MCEGLTSSYDVTKYVQTFNGEGKNVHEDFLSWIEAWNREADKLAQAGRTPQQMLGEMRRTLKGEALKTIKNTPLEGNGYLDALDGLKDIFLNVQGVVRSLINQLISTFHQRKHS